jgi:hypothetical protein
MSILNVIGMIPKGGRFAKSVVNFVHQVPQNWGKFKSAIQQIDDLLKQGKVKLDGKQKTNFEANKNILKNHEKVTKKVEVAPVKKEDPFLGWTPTLHQRSNLRNVYKDLDPPVSKYTKEMEIIDEELDALVFGGDKYRKWSEVEKAKLFKKLQADMKKLIDATKKEDLTTLSLGEINKKSHDLQKRVREIADNPNIPGTVHEGPKKDMIAAIYDSENPLIRAARQKLIKANNLKKYGDKFPRLDPENDSFIIVGLDETGNPIKMSRFVGKFTASPDQTTGKWSRSGTSFYDKWNSKTGKLREEGKEVFHETLDTKGNVIMSNPNYQLPKTKRLDVNQELYRNTSTSDLAKQGYELKDIDMIVKGRIAKDYLTKTKNKDHNIAMHEQTSESEVIDVMEDLYTRGDDVYKMSIKEWTESLPKFFAQGGYVPGYATGGISNLFRQRQGFRTGNIAKLPEFLKFVEKLLIKASNEIRQGIGKWRGLDQKQRIVQHDNLTKLVTEFQKTKKFDKSFNEYFGIDAEKAFIEAQAEVKATRKAKDLELLKNYKEENPNVVLSYGSKDSIPGDEGIQLAILKGNFERKYTGIIDDRLMKQVLADNDPQRISEVMATIDQSLIMQEKGMKTADIMETLKESFKRRPNVEGGLIPGYATGGVSNLFRRR